MNRIVLRPCWTRFWRSACTHSSLVIPTDTPGSARIPCATYRLQFNNRFTFRDARAITAYLDALGISDLYASSYLKAVPGSLHGYDVADPTQLNPEVGTETEYREWIAMLQSFGMGHILDLVPNHLGIARSANPWWLDVLENGASSKFAHVFDIEWRPVKDELAHKVLIPILGDQYGAVLERQELRLTYADGAFHVQYSDNLLPIAPDTYPRILEHGLESWLDVNGERITGGDADEFRSIITAASNLPPRTSQSPDDIGVRAREKEVVKRRLASVLERTPALAEFLDATLVAFNGEAGRPRTFDLLDGLLNEQSYRLAHWRVASEEINYRRFFDVNQLAAVRMEDPAVFDEVHRYAFELAERGAATGFRVDHVDGLYAPADYLRRLQERTGVPSFYVVVEKILQADEQLPPDWPVYGTTGYEFSAAVNNLFVDSRHERTLDETYARFLRERRARLSFDEVAYRSRKLIMHETMSGDINSLGHQLNRFSERNRHYRDFTLYSLISTLKEVIACFPVYRTYVTESEPARSADRRHLHQAIRCAKRRSQGVAPVVFDFIERLLLNETRVTDPDACAERARFVGKFQQMTSPVVAKGIEDTAFYVYNRLLSLNEVGSDPTRFGLDPATVHARMAERQRQWPAALSATSTHDSKRGEDVRARLNVLSEIPGAWRSAVTEWRALNRRLKRDVRDTPAPDANEEYSLYQILLGAWPLCRELEDEFKGRIRAYVVKALREAKVNTSWLSPDDEYESAVLQFVEGLFDPDRPFLRAFRPFQQRVADLGMYNGLAQVLIKLTAPGVPDFYQGTELWDLSLVDPDNRGPVDYELRRTLLENVSEAAEGAQKVETLLAARADGRIKLFTITRALRLRRSEKALFLHGEYTALATGGSKSEHLFAFARHHGSGIAVTAVPRLIAGLTPGGAPPIGPDIWGDTELMLPTSLGHRLFENVFTGERMNAWESDRGFTIRASDLFRRFPVALLAAGDR
jgi:(1->4)-alpha-D-glucan 1-alpha-D-glucosylmutase